MMSIARFLTAVSLAATLAHAQIQPGLRLFGHLGERETYLIDEIGTVVHTWTHEDIPGTGVYLDSDGTLLRTFWTGTLYPIQGTGGGLRRFALDGTQTWEFRYDSDGVMLHHDFAIMPNGNILMLAWEEKSQQDAIAAGRDPALLVPGPFRPDHIIEVQPTPDGGEIVWAWHAWDHLVQDRDPALPNYGVIAEHPERIDINYPPIPVPSNDFNHANGIDFDPIRDLVIVSMRAQNEVWIIDHSTTTEEAAGSTGGAHGKGGDLLYRWGNPLAYGRGTIDDVQFLGQHSPTFIPPGRPGAGNVLVFNNGAQNPGGSSIDEIVLPIAANGTFVEPVAGASFGPAAPIWSYSAADFGSSFVSSAERLPNGNTLVCSGQQAWLFEVTVAGQRVWDYVSEDGFVFHAHFVDRTLWANRTELSLTDGGTVQFDILHGALRGNQSYLLVGSSSGTSPGLSITSSLTLPLNFDGYMLTSLNSANTYPYAGTAGVLDSHGAATASFTIPPALLPIELAGTRLDHALVVWGPGNYIQRVSNPVGFTFVP